MDVIGWLLGLIGIAVSVGIAIWQYRKAVVAEKHLALALVSLPDILLAGVTKVLANASLTDTADASSNDSYPGFETSYADVDGDGNQELLVRMSAGAYSSVLLIYGIRDWEFQKIGELYSTTLGGFEVADLDGDGRLEVRTDEIAQRPELPYVAGLRDEVIHKFLDGKFVEIERKECFSEQEMQERKVQFSHSA